MNLPPLTRRIVEIGYEGIELVSVDDLEDFQIGYSVGANNQSLVGEHEGDWLKNWVVIGLMTSMGDPIFIDVSNLDFPVYTSLHGQDQWEPDLISKTYEGFLQILEKLSILAKGRDCPEALEENPMTQKEYDEFVTFAKDAGELDDAFFWGLMISDDEAGIGPEFD